MGLSPPSQNKTPALLARIHPAGNCRATIFCHFLSVPDKKNPGLLQAPENIVCKRYLIIPPALPFAIDLQMDEAPVVLSAVNTAVGFAVSHQRRMFPLASMEALMVYWVSVFVEAVNEVPLTVPRWATAKKVVEVATGMVS